MRKLTAKEFVMAQLEGHRGEWVDGDYQSIEYGDYAESTIRKAIRACGFGSTISDCGDMYAKYLGGVK